METLTITNDQRSFAWRRVHAIKLATRARYNGSIEDQYAGELGETVFADAFGFARPSAIEYDHGIDFTIGDKFVDLKTSHAPKPIEPYWSTNIVSDQLDDPRRKTDAYLFAHIDTVAGTFTLIGWARPDEYRRQAHHVRVGDKIGSRRAWRDTFNLRYDQLRPWHGFDAFGHGLASWGK